MRTAAAIQRAKLAAEPHDEAKYAPTPIRVVGKLWHGFLFQVWTHPEGCEIFAAYCTNDGICVRLGPVHEHRWYWDIDKRTHGYVEMGIGDVLRARDEAMRQAIRVRRVLYVGGSTPTQEERG